MKKTLLIFNLLVFSFYSAQQDSLDYIQEIIITSGEFKQSKKKTPQQIISLNQKDIENENLQTSADLLQNTGEVFVQKSQAGGGSPVLRGFEASRVLIVVDGVRMNNAIYRSGHLQNVITLDANALEKVEVINGPGSVLYGSDALGGVMYFKTQRPNFSTGNFSFTGDLMTRYASANNSHTSFLNINYANKKWAGRTIFTYSKFGDVRQGTKGNALLRDIWKRQYYVISANGEDFQVQNKHTDVQKGSGYEQYDLLQKIRYKPNENIDHLLNFQYSISSNVNRYDRMTDTDTDGNLVNAQWYYGPQRRLLSSYTLNIKSENSFFDEGNLIAAYQNIEESRHNRRFNNKFLNHRKENVDVFSINLDFRKRWGDHTLMYGTEEVYNKVRSTAYRQHIISGEKRSLSTRYPDGGSSTNTLSAYLTHSCEPISRFVFSEGVRFSSSHLEAKFVDKTYFPFLEDKIRQNNFSLSGNIGVVYLPGQNWKFVVLGSTGYRVPNVDDLAKVFDSQPGTVIIPNPDIKPENTYNAELGISKRLGSSVTLEGTAYYTWYKNALTLKKTRLNGEDVIIFDGVNSEVMMPANSSSGYIYGWNAKVSFQPLSWITLSSTLNYTYGRLKDNHVESPMGHISPLFGKTSLQIKMNKHLLDIYALYNGAKKLKDYAADGEDNLKYATPEGMPSWTTFNIKSTISLNQFLKLQLAVENILDENYRAFSSGINAPGRNFVVGIRGSF